MFRRAVEPSPVADKLRTLITQIECNTATLRCDVTVKDAASRLRQTGERVKSLLGDPVSFWKLRNRWMADRVADPMFLVDGEHIIRFVNQAVTDKTGKGYEEYLGRAISEVFQSEGDIDREISEMVSVDGRDRSTIRVRFPDMNLIDHKAKIMKCSTETVALFEIYLRPHT